MAAYSAPPSEQPAIGQLDPRLFHQVVRSVHYVVRIRPSRPVAPPKSADCTNSWDLGHLVETVNTIFLVHGPHLVSEGPLPARGSSASFARGASTTDPPGNHLRLWRFSSARRREPP